MTAGSAVDVTCVGPLGGDEQVIASVVCLGTVGATAAIRRAWWRSNPSGLDLILAQSPPKHEDLLAEAVAERLRRPFALLVCNGFPDSAVALLNRQDLPVPLLRIFVPATDPTSVPAPWPPEPVADADLRVIAVISGAESDMTTTVVWQWRRAYGSRLAVRLIGRPEAATSADDGLPAALADDVVRVVAEEMRAAPATIPFAEAVSGGTGRVS